MPPNRSDNPRSLPRLLAASLLPAVAFGLAGGYLDVLAREARRLLVEPLIFAGHHVWWAAPVATVAFFVPLGLGLTLLGLILRRLPVGRVSLWVFTFFSVFAGLYSFPLLGRPTGLLLSAGVATMVLRFAVAHESRIRQALALMALALGAPTVVIAGAMIGADELRERRALARLPAARAGAPNVLLLVLDTVRAMNLNLYGYSRSTTPGLARWAAEGTTFERAYSTAPWTLPSHASIMTGQWARDLSTDWMVPLDDRQPTLAEAFDGAGYRTGGFVANTDYCSREVGLDRGFSHYEDYTLDPGQLLYNSSLWRAVARIEPIRALIGNYDNLGRRTAPDINRAFLDWLDDRGDRPFFAFLNYYDAHRPYLPPAPFATRFRTPGVPLHPRYRKENGDDPNPSAARIQGAIDAYDNAIAYLDHELQLLFRELAARGLAQHTIIIVTADHGEEFMEHGFWDHGNSLYVQAVRVPLVIVGPGVGRGVRVAEPVTLRDLARTIANLAGVSTVAFPGRPLVGMPEGEAGLLPDSVVISTRQVPRQADWYPVSHGDMASVVVGSLYFIRNLGSGREQLYDLDSDPGEQTDLVGTPRADSLLPALRAATDRVAPVVR